MVAVELVDDHQRVEVAEGDEAEGQDAQGPHAFGYEGCLVGSKETGDGLGEGPGDGTGDEHGNGDEAERPGDDEAEHDVVTPAHLNGAERLDGSAGARKEEVVDIQDVHADGEGEDARSP